jgi:hypothetical protein
LPPNLGQVFCIPCLEGRFTIAPDAHATFLKMALKSDKIRTSAFGGVRELTDEAYDLACARYLLLSRDEPLISSDRYSLAYDGDLRIYENTGALEIQEGSYTIVMRFRPGSLRIAVFATCIGVLASLLCLWRARSRPSFCRTEHRV